MSFISNKNTSTKRFDFVVKTDNCIYGIETNFYASGGSKLNETARSYKMIAEEADKVVGFEFVWFTDGLKKVRELLDSKDIIEDFDQEIFNAIVDYVIVGGNDENVIIDPYLIRFILKREFDLSVPKDVPDDVIIQNNKIDLNSNNVDEKFVGIITGNSYYKEVHISDLIILDEYRNKHIGSKLVQTVEDYFKGKGFENINLTTYGFQAPEFYKKCGFEVEFIRKNKKNSKLDKYHLVKYFGGN